MYMHILASFCQHFGPHLHSLICMFLHICVVLLLNLVIFQFTLYIANIPRKLVFSIKLLPYLSSLPPQACNRGTEPELRLDCLKLLQVVDIVPAKSDWP